MGTGESEPGAHPILSLLADPALQGALGSDPSTFEFLRRVVARAGGEVELALTGIVPAGIGPAGMQPAGGDMPLVIARARLAPADAERMRVLLADAETAQPERVVGGHQVYRLTGREAAAGFQLEAAIVGNDFVAANHGSGLDEALGGGTRAQPADGRGVLGADPRFLKMREQLAARPGAVVVFADWQRFRRRLATVEGLAGVMVDWSGLGGAEYVMASIDTRAGETAADGRAWLSTVLLSFADRDGDGHRGPGRERGRRRGGIDGWLALLEPSPLSRLVDDVPAGGLGGLVLSIAPERLLERGASPLGRLGFASVLRGGCGRCGVDLDGFVGRLGERGAVQWLWLRDADDRVVPAFALQTKSRAAANDLLAQVGGAVEERRLGRASRAQGRRPAMVEIHGRRGDSSLHIGAVDDVLVFAQDGAVIDAAHAERRAKPAIRLETVVGQAVHAFSGRRQSLSSIKVSGLVHLDAAGWLEANGLVPASGKAGVGQVDERDDDQPPAGGGDSERVALPTRHTGLLDVIADGGPAGTVLRLQLFSTN